MSALAMNLTEVSNKIDSIATFIVTYSQYRTTRKLIDTDILPYRLRFVLIARLPPLRDNFHYMVRLYIIIVSPFESCTFETYPLEFCC